MSVIPRQFCEECRLHIPFYAPDKFIHKRKVYHLSCFKKKFAPKADVVSEQVKVQLIDKLLKDEKEIDGFFHT